MSFIHQRMLNKRFEHSSIGFGYMWTVENATNPDTRGRVKFYNRNITSADTNESGSQIEPMWHTAIEFFSPKTFPLLGIVNISTVNNLHHKITYT